VPQGETEDRDWQRLDKWLWCARIMRTRADCSDLASLGTVRINRQPTAKPHAKLRIGDVLTIPLHNQVRILRITALALRRGASSDARLLYVDVSDVSATSCAASGKSAYRAA